MFTRDNPLQWRSLFALFCFLAAVSLSAQGPTEPARDQVYDAALVNRAVKKWAARHDGFVKTRPTVLFANSLSQCSGCCASAVNNLLKGIKRQRYDVNVLVVIGTEIPKEGMAVARLFDTRNVAEDADGILNNVFHADAFLPDLYIVEPNGKVRHRIRDIQHDPNALSQLASLNLPLANIPVIKPRHTASLHENDDRTITQAFSASLGARSIFFIDPRLNVIYSHDVATGAFIDAVTIPDSLDFYFRSPQHNQSYWKSLADNYWPLTKIMGIVPSVDGDTLWIIASFHIGYDTAAMPDGRKHVAWKRGIGIVSLSDGKFGKVRILPPSNTFADGPFKSVGIYGLIAPCYWDDGRPVLSDSARHDSTHMFARVSANFDAIMPMLHVSQVELMYRKYIRPNYIAKLCGDMGGRVVVLDDGNGVFVRVDLKDSPSLATPIQPAGLLARVMRNGSGAAGDADSSDSVWVIDVSMRNSVVYVLLGDARKQSNRAQVVIQTYDSDGNFISEHALANSADSLMEGHVAGYSDAGLVIISKWKKERWKLTTVALNLLD